MDPVPVNPVATATVVEPLPAMRWGAIFAGWAVAIGIATVLYLGGTALGLASLHAHDPDGAAKAVGMGTCVWVVLTWVASLFVGGMFASWFDGRDDQMMGSLHGVSVWGVSILATILMLACGAGHMTSRPHDGQMHGASSMAGSSELALDAAVLHAQLNAQLRGTGGPSTPVSPTTADDTSTVPPDANRASVHPGSPRDAGVDMVAAALVSKHSNQAQALLVAQGATDADATRITQALEPQASKVREDAKQAADKAAKHAAMVAGLLALTALLSMLAAALGGWLGAHHIHHVYHLRVYKRSP